MGEKEAAHGQGEFQQITVVDLSGTDFDADLKHPGTGEIWGNTPVSVVERPTYPNLQGRVDGHSHGTLDLVGNAEFPSRVLVGPLGPPDHTPCSDLDLAQDGGCDEGGLGIRLVALEVFIEGSECTVIGIAHEKEVEIGRVAAGHIVLGNCCIRRHTHREKQRHQSQGAGASLRGHQTLWPARIP